MWYCAFNVPIQPYHIRFYYRPEHGIWGGILTNRVDGCCTELRSAIEYYERDQIITNIWALILLMWYCAFNVPIQPYHIRFYYRPTRTWDLGGDFDKSCWRMLHGAEKRDRVLRTWPNHHKYMGVDIIDVILCVQRADTTLSHTFLLPTRTWDLGGDFDKSCWRMLHGAEKRDRVLRTWPNHHKYMGVDIIDVILCVQRADTTLSHTFLLPTRTWDLGGILTNRVDGCCTELRSAIEYYERDQQIITNIWALILLMWYCAFNVPIQPYHIRFYYRPEHGIWGGLWHIGLTDVARSWEAR